MKMSDMSEDAKAYYAGGRRVVTSGVPCRFRADTKDLKAVSRIAKRKGKAA